MAALETLKIENDWSGKPITSSEQAMKAIKPFIEEFKVNFLSSSHREACFEYQIPNLFKNENFKGDKCANST